jgi:hypothetical protein
MGQVAQVALCLGDLPSQDLRDFLDCQGIAEIRAFFKVPEIGAKGLEMIDFGAGTHVCLVLLIGSNSPAQSGVIRITQCEEVKGHCRYA